MAKLKKSQTLADESVNLFANMMLGVSFGLPQKSVGGFDKIWEDLADITNDPMCRSFIADLIGTAQDITGKQAHAFSVEGMLAELARHPMNGTNGVGLFPTGTGGGAGGWDEKTGLGFANLDSRTYTGSLRAAQRDLALAFLHEITHTATKGNNVGSAWGGYEDVELAQAVFAMFKDPKDDLRNRGNYPGNMHPTYLGGVIWDRALRKFCK